MFIVLVSFIQPVIQGFTFTECPVITIEFPNIFFFLLLFQINCISGSISFFLILDKL